MLTDIPDKDKFSIEGPDEAGYYSATFLAFNTVVTLKCWSTQLDSSEMNEAIKGVIDLCRHYEWLLSRTLKESEIYQVNHSEGEYVEISPETAQAIRFGLFYGGKSAGRFDITMGSVTRLWDFKNHVIPETEELHEALLHVDWRHVDVMDLEKEGETHYFARLLDRQACIDLGGMAKGLIADKIITYLYEHKVQGAFINLGGNVAVFGGKHDGSQWRIGIQSPFEQGKINGVMSLADGSVVTSGLYERCFTKDGVFYHHILDNITGYPVDTDVAGVSVVANLSRDADGYSTTLFALGSKEALRFVEKIDGIEAIVVTKDKKILTSKGLNEFLQ